MAALGAHIEEQIKNPGDLTISYSYGDVPTIKKFSASNARIRGLMGPFGSGKSTACVIEIIKRGLAQKPGKDGIRRSRWAVIRNTYRMLADTTIKTFHQWVPPHAFGEWRASDSRYLIKAFEGAEIEVLFRALDRPDQIGNLLSMELTGAWVNEAREVPWAIIDALGARIDRYPAKNMGGPTWSGIFMDTNPPDVDSKWFKFFEEPHIPEFPPGYAAIFKQPSGLADNAENLSNIPSGRAYYENLQRGKDPDWIKVYVHGEYGFVIDGRPVFPEYSDQWHCKPIKPIKGVDIYRGWDFGLTPAVVFCQLTPKGQFIVIDECVANDMGIDRHSDDVLDKSTIEYAGYNFIDIGDPAGTQRAQTDEKTCFQILGAKGIDIQPGPQTLAIRLESVRKVLTKTAEKGEPMFLVDPRCKELRKGLQGGYQFRRLKTSDERFSTYPDKNKFSHVCDALQYAAGYLFGEGLTIARSDGELQMEGFDFGQDTPAAGRSEITGY